MGGGNSSVVYTQYFTNHDYSVERLRGGDIVSNNFLWDPPAGYSNFETRAVEIAQQAAKDNNLLKHYLSGSIFPYTINLKTGEPIYIPITDYRYQYQISTVVGYQFHKDLVEKAEEVKIDWIESEYFKRIEEWVFKHLVMIDRDN